MVRQVDVRIMVSRGGAQYSELIPVSAPTLKMDTTAKIKTSLSGSFLNNETVDWLKDEIVPQLIIDGVASPCGVFIPTTVVPSEENRSKTVKVIAYDRCWLVQSTKAESTVYFAAGTNYISAIVQLLTTCGIALISQTPTTLSLAEAREWEMGTDYLSIINEMLDEINYESLRFTNQGYALLKPKTLPNAVNIKHTFDSSDVKSLLLPQISRSMDIFSTPNVFICVCSNPDKDVPMVATAVNDSPLSPLSVSKRGRRIAKVYNVDNIADQATLNEYAKQLRNESMQIGEIITVNTGLRAAHGVGDTIALHYNDLDAICRESAWTMQLETGGTMSHILERVVYSF